MGDKSDEKSGEFEKNDAELGPEVGDVGKIFHIGWIDFTKVYKMIVAT